MALTFPRIVFLDMEGTLLQKAYHLDDGTVAPSAFQMNVITSAGKDTQSAPKDRFTPLMRVAACLPAGASCNKDADCCTQSCTPMHHKCAGR